jgi:hypothetical protein
LLLIIVRDRCCSLPILNADSYQNVISNAIKAVNNLSVLMLS